MTHTIPAYDLQNVRLNYGRINVLNIDHLTIESGTITGLVGPNGSGKSTLLKLLAFCLKPACGTILYNGKKEYCFSPAVRSKITLLTQSPCLLKRTVFENVAYGLKIRNDRADLDQRVSTALMGVGLAPEAFAPRPWHQLSGGEAQRVALAARLILRPQVLLLDEPVASVDANSAELIRNAALNARKEWGTTLVIASHDRQWLNAVTDTQLSIYNTAVFAMGIENIIPGPYETSGTSFLKKHLDTGQHVLLRAPQKPHSIAVIRQDALSVESPDCPADRQQRTERLDQPAENRLSGKIISMQLDKSNTVLTDIAVQDLTFSLRLNPDQISISGLYPGKCIMICFSPDSVDWL